MSSSSDVTTPLSIPSDTRSWVEIDLAAIRHNADVVRKSVGPEAGIMAIIKANAYGHGMREVAQTLAPQAASFGVANLGEALELTSFGLGRPILLLGPCLPSEREAAIAEGLICTVSSAEEGEAYGRAADGHVALLNFKIDTGMGRIGCWQEEAIEELRRLATMPNISVRMVSTHLPSADEDEAFTCEQLVKFEKLAGESRKIVPDAKIHALNSAGILRFPDFSYDLVRPGLMLYGSAYPAWYQSLLKPALTWKARVVLVRDVGPGRGVSYGRTHITNSHTRTATVPVGYADGFPRQASGKGSHLLIGGKRCPVLGRVTMDQIVADVTECGEVHEGDEAVIIGRQGDDQILAQELAEQAGTIAWDVFTGIKGRVQRYYLR